MDEMKCKCTYRIRSYEVDETNRVRLSVLWDIMQDAASIHADMLGFDFNALFHKSVFWMLCRMKLEIFRYPQMGEELTVITNPSGIDKIFAYRDYEAYGSNGKIIVKGRSSWILANINTLRPERIKEHIPKLDVSVVGEVPGKIIASGNLIGKNQLKAEYEDIDVNKHVNNGRYVHWIENAMDTNGIDPHPKCIQVNFIAEEKKGSDIDVLHYKCENKFYFEMINTEGKLVLQAEGA